MNYRKIAVVGISGSGKSVFSRQLSSETGLPVFHMDALFWRGNWESVPEPEYLQEHESLVQKNEWIIEGWIDAKMSNRLKKADVVLYLDYSGIRCAARLIKRWFQFRNKNRPELPKEAIEGLSLKFLWRVITRAERKGIEEAIEISKPLELKRFHSPKELSQFM
ncbi:MAG: hypothetical protein V4467_01145 [Patescibacteria group bacterium]